jgi:predicted hotdog family 3-hydroxylacyl-ACP dehydratase
MWEHLKAAQVEGKTFKTGLPYSITETLPHRGKLVLLDELIEYGPTHAVCAVTVREDSPFFEPGRGVPAWVAMEYMAQTVAVYGGIVRLQAGLDVQIALLLGARSCEIACDYFVAGQRLLARGEVLVQDGSGVGAYACELRDGERLLVRAEAKAFQPEDISGFLHALSREAP